MCIHKEEFNFHTRSVSICLIFWLYWSVLEAGFSLRLSSFLCALQYQIYKMVVLWLLMVYIVLKYMYIMGVIWLMYLFLRTEQSSYVLHWCQCENTNNW